MSTRESLSAAEMDAEHLQLEAEYLAAQIAYKAAQERVSEAGKAYLKAQCGVEISRSVVPGPENRVRITTCNLRKAHDGEHRNTFADREVAS